MSSNDTSTADNTNATSMNTTIMIITNVVTLALFIMSELIPFLHPPETGVVQGLMVACNLIKAGITPPLKASGEL